MIKKFKKRLENKDNRNLVENFISLSTVQVFSMVLPLVTLPYILRVLGLANYGSIVLAGSLIAYFTSVTDYSFKITATRDVAVFRNSKRKLDLIYSKVMILKTLLFLVSFAIISTIVLLYPPFYKARLLFFLTVPMLIGNTIFPDWFFLGMEKMKYITILNLCVNIIFTTCVFVFIKHKEDYWKYPLIQSSGLILSGIVAQVILIKKYKLNFIFLKPATIGNALKANFPIFVNQCMPQLYNNTSTFLLGILTNTITLGTYDAIKKIVDLCIVLVGIVSRVFFPFLNRKNNAFLKYKKLMMMIGITLTILPILFYKPILWYLNLDNSNSFYTLAVLAIGIFGFCLYDIFGTNYFIIKRQDKIVMNNTIRSSLIGFALAWPLVGAFGILGAAINLSFTRYLMGLGLFFKYKKHVAGDI